MRDDEWHAGDAVIHALPLVPCPVRTHGATVVSGEYYQRLLVFPRLLQGVEYATDLLVYERYETVVFADDA